MSTALHAEPELEEDVELSAAIERYRTRAPNKAERLPGDRDFRAVSSSARRLQRALLKCGLLTGVFTMEASRTFNPDCTHSRFLVALEAVANLAERAQAEGWLRRPVGSRGGPEPDLCRRMLEHDVATILEGRGHRLTTAPSGVLALTLVRVYEAAGIRGSWGKGRDKSPDADSLFRVLRRLINRNRQQVPAEFAETR